jgi:hypothetical protein
MGGAVKAPLFRMVFDHDEIRVWILTKIVENSERNKTHSERRNGMITPRLVNPGTVLQPA